MLRWTLIFLVVALVAAIFGFGGIAAGRGGYRTGIVLHLSRALCAEPSHQPLQRKKPADGPYGVKSQRKSACEEGAGEKPAPFSRGVIRDLFLGRENCLANLFRIGR